jgi:uncharacterized membrane protein (UPF0136 family)
MTGYVSALDVLEEEDSSNLAFFCAGSEEDIFLVAIFNLVRCGLIWIWILDFCGGHGDRKAPDNEFADGHHLRSPPTHLLTMNNPQQVNKAMSVLLAIGGMIGFAKSGSKMSLFSGLISAATYHKAANEMGSSSTSSSKRQAHKQSFYCSAILFVVMFMRYLKTGKIMPSGAVALIAGYTAKLGYDNMKNK